MPVFSASQIRQLGYIVEERVAKVIDRVTPVILSELLETIDKSELSRRLMTECQESNEFRCAPIAVCSFDWTRNGVYPDITGIHVQWIDIVAQPSFLERFANCLGPKHFTVKMVKEGSKAVLRASFTARDHGRQKESNCLYNETGFIPLLHIVEEGVCSCCGSYTTDIEGQIMRRTAAQEEWNDMIRMHDNNIRLAEKRFAAIDCILPERRKNNKEWEEAHTNAQETLDRACYNRKWCINHFIFKGE